MPSDDPKANTTESQRPTQPVQRNSPARANTAKHTLQPGPSK